MTKPAETLPPRSPAETARPPAQTASEGAASDFWPFESQDVYVTLCEPSQFKSYNRPQVPLTDKFDTSAYTIRRIYGLNELTAALRRGYKNEGLNLVEISAAAAATDGAAAGHNAPPRRDRVKIELQDDTAKMSQTIIEFGFTDQLVGYPTAPPASADAKSPVFVQLEEQLKSCVVELQETSTRRSSYVFLTKPNLKAGKLESRYPVAAGEKAKPKDGSADSQEPDYGIWEIDLASYGLVDVKSQAFVRLVGLAGENEARWEPDSLIPVQASDQAKWAFSKLAKGAAADTKLKLQSAEVTLKIEGTKLAFTLDILLDVPTAQADALAPLLPVEIRDRRKELQELRRDTSGSILMDKTAREKSEPMLKQLGRLIGVPALDLPDKARGEGTGSPLGGSVLDQKPPQNSRVTREEYRSRAIEIRNTTDKALAELSRIERSASILGVELYRVVEVEQGRKVGSPIVGIPLTKVPREFHRKSPRPALRAPSLPTASALPATSASRLPQAPATLPGAGGKP